MPPGGFYLGYKDMDNQQPFEIKRYKTYLIIIVQSWTKIYRIIFSENYKTNSKWNFLEFLELGIRPH